MISFEIFLIGLLIISTFVSLVTEAVKKILVERNVTYHANSLVGIVAIVLSVAVSVGYAVLTKTPFTAQICVYVILMVFMSWLCSMVGYDKVIQAIKQFKTDEKDVDE